MTVKQFRGTTHDSTELVEFNVDEDTFYAYPVMPGGTLLDLSAMSESSGAEQAKSFLGFLDAALDQSSAELFAKRFRDPAHPIDLACAGEIVRWLMEEHYSPNRPTGRPSPSRPGPRPTGPSSTDVAPSTE